MSVPSSVEELVQLIRKSGMVDEAKLDGYLQRREIGRGLPDDSREAAEAMVRDGILTNFQSEQFLLGKWRGFTIGKYKLLERIGVGGMGQVFLCEHLFMKRRVAIKVLPPAKAESPAALGRFYREARAAGSIGHPNIVRTHDIDQDGNLHFIVMEYVDGTNLLDIVKRFGALPIGRAAHYVRQIADALDFAFRSGIVHRDVKPGNILIDRKGTAHILDMGLARFFKDQSDNLTVKYDDKIVLGTADYVAPEQVANSHSVDVRADIYGLGATLYFVLAGHPPFPAGTVSQKLLWHRTKEPTPIQQIRPDVPDGLAAVLTRMMAKDPARRYQTPAEAAAALASYVPAHVPPPAAAEMPQLCPAAMDTAQDAAETPIGLTDARSAQPEPVAAGVGAFGQAAAPPFGPPARGTSTRLGHPVGRASGHTSTAVANPNRPLPTAAAPFGPMPFAPGYQPPVAVSDLTPLNGVPHQAPFALTAAEVAGAKKPNRGAVIAAAVATLILGAAGAFWAFGK